VKLRIHDTLASLDAGAWNALAGTDYPFLRHEFLSTLERTQSIGGESGWNLQLITLEDTNGLAAAAPGWIKTHSYGEFVFDFAWAQAYHQHGLSYYPKLILAAPFTPATGPRLLCRNDLAREATLDKLIDAIEQTALDQGCSSVHALFPTAQDQTVFAKRGWLARKDCQFHWSNRGWRDFEDYLGSFTSEKRKKARRERRRVAEAGIRFETVWGHEASELQALSAWQLHRITFLRRGNEPYLNAQSFLELCRSMGDSLMFKLALLGDEIVACAVFFVGRDTLYGRYWGAAEDFHSLHFETCYHQGIEFCIERGLARFEPGTQGEHKVSRGFEPTDTASAHRIFDERFARAIDDYLRRERVAVDRYAANVREHIPFRLAPDTAADSSPDTAPAAS
jgi:predicted N-acyltransferase